VDGVPDLSLALPAAVILAITIGWTLFQHARTRPRRPPPSSATLDLGDEPPAIVDLLTDGFAVTPQSVPATLVDLAARRRLAIEQYGDRIIIRVPATTNDDELTAFERRVLDHVRELAVDGVVPAEVMSTGPRGASKSWWRAFRREVNEEGQRLGYCRDRWSKAMLSPIWIGVLASGGVLWLADHRADVDAEVSYSDPAVLVFGITVLVLAALVVALVTLPQRDLQRDTDAGLAAASRWMGVREYMATVGDFEDKPAAMVALWDRHLAYAVALDLAPQVVRELPLGAEDHHHAWSMATGRWRPVRVRYPILRPGYGQHPVMALISGLFFGGLAAAALVLSSRVLAGQVGMIADMPDSGQRVADRVALVVGAVALMLIAWNAWRVVAAIAGMLSTTEVEGVLLRKRARYGWVGLTDEPAGSSDRDVRTRYYLALDAGDASTVVAWIVRRQVFDAVVQGERYRVRIVPKIGYVSTCERLPSGQPDVEPHGAA
jgi:hypothetical protein